MKRLMVTLFSFSLLGCGASQNSVVTEAVRSGLTLEELALCAFYVPREMTFVSQKPGEITGEDLFKVERKTTFSILDDTPGRLVGAGDGWLNIEFNEGIVLMFRRDDTTGDYLTPSWGGITIKGERFDIKVGVLTGEYLPLLIKQR